MPQGAALFRAHQQWLMPKANDLASDNAALDVYFSATILPLTGT